MSSHCDIVNLPIEILDLVYKYIPRMRDKLNLAKSHCVLRKAFAFHARNITILCTDIGHTEPKLASMHCPNLSYIELLNCFENLSVVDTLLLMPKLKHLKLSGFNYDDLDTVGKLSSLTKLTLKSSSYLNFFRVIRSLKNINSLELDYGFFRKPKYLAVEPFLPKIELLKVNYGIFRTPLPYLPTLKNLTIRDINYRNSLSDVFGKSVISYGKTLESLNFCTNCPLLIKDDEIEILMKLKALKKVERSVRSDDCLQDICQLENLEELNLPNSKITNRGVIMVISRSKKLQKLNICGCDLVNRDMLKEAVAALQHCPRKSDKPFLLRVSPSFGDVDKSKLGGVLAIEYIEDDF